MKKCRSVNIKLIVPIVSLFFALSAFFYTPINVYAYTDSVYIESAGSVTDVMGLTSTSTRYHSIHLYQYEMPSIDFQLDINTNYYYQVSFESVMSFTLDRESRVKNTSILLKNPDYPEQSYLINTYELLTGTTTSVSNTQNCSFIVKGDWFSNVVPVFTSSILLTSDTSSFDFLDLTLTLNDIDIVRVEDTGGPTYEQGYQLGYDTGYQDGFDDGSSSGYTDGFNAGYDEGLGAGFSDGYNQGVQSVDTQSYYDSGYEAGYNAGVTEAYQTGYDAGFTSGYDDAMSRIEGWGADSSEYPLTIIDEHLSIPRNFYVSTTKHIENVYMPFTNLPDFQFDPTHIYAISFDNIDFTIDSYEELPILFNYDLTAYCGDSRFLIDKMSDTGNLFFPGYDAGNIGVCFEFSSQAINTSNNIVFSFNCDFKLYDYGPQGNTQNHIANQTDELTNGYDDSAGQETSSQFSDGVAEYEDVEGSLFTSAKTGLTNYQFFDISSVPAVVTGLSFVTSIMTGIFNSMGGASGAGIVLSVLFSVMLVSIVAGLYRYFVSNGRSGKHSRKGGGN